MLCESVLFSLLAVQKPFDLFSHCASLHHDEHLLTILLLCSRIVNLGIGALMVASGIFHCIPVGM